MVGYRWWMIPLGMTISMSVFWGLVTLHPRAEAVVQPYQYKPALIQTVDGDGFTCYVMQADHANIRPFVVCKGWSQHTPISVAQ